MVSIKLAILCVCYLVLEAKCGKVSYIEPCVWSDKACLLNSANKVLPYFVEGIKEFGSPSVDPIVIKEAVADSGDLKLKFEDLTVVGLKKAVLRKVEADKQKSTLVLGIETPIHFTGTYTAGGSLLGVPVEGHGKTELKSEKVKLTVKAKLQQYDKNGKQHYKIESYDLKFKFLDEIFIDFSNLFNGDKSKADPILTIIHEGWRDLVPSIGQPVIQKLVDVVINAIKQLLDNVPCDELELPA